MRNEGQKHKADVEEVNSLQYAQIILLDILEVLYLPRI